MPKGPEKNIFSKSRKKNRKTPRSRNPRLKIQGLFFRADFTFSI
jgi:hypothetical protein